jgi:hypothetical protein
MSVGGISRVVLLFLALQTVFAEFSLVLDQTLQSFREEILKFQRNSIIQVDGAFFSFYELLYSKMNDSVIRRQIQLKDEFNSSCSNFPMYTLEPMAARRLINICDDIQLIADRVLRSCDTILERYYPTIETLNTESVHELLAKDFFESSEKHFDLIVPIYNQNSSCVAPLLGSFLGVYRKPIDLMLKSCKRMTKMVNKAVERDLKYIRTSSDKLSGVATKMVKCSNDSVIDTFGCVSDFVGYDCFKRKSGCGVFYKSIYMILDHMKHIESYYKQYDVHFHTVFESIRTTEERLAEWLDSTDYCLMT